MNPFAQLPSQSFSLLPPSPNPSPNPNFSNPATPFRAISSSIADLSATLTNLINLSHHTLASLSNLLPSLQPSDANFTIQCPFNPNHRMPPRSLFLHHLRCPSSPRPIPHPSDLLATLTYTNTLNSSNELRYQNRSMGSLSESDGGEPCFSTDPYLDFSCDFFYRDCPGVVTVCRGNGFRRTLTLPFVLSAECVDFCSRNNAIGNDCFLQFDGRILPSDFWVMKRQVESWSDFPGGYSCTFLTAILGITVVKMSDFSTWVITNSPRYGVVIDLSMSSHIMFLLSLCFKAVVREAMTFLGMTRNQQNLGISNFNFKCPALVESLTWLASQLSVLYGEPAGKFFALALLKLCILHGASRLLFRPLEANPADCFAVEELCPLENGKPLDKNHDAKTNGSLEEERRNREGNVDVLGTTVAGSEIFVSQIVAAVGALCERSLLEDKIRGMWSSQPPTKYQLIAEHNDVSQKAEEERGKRPNYRPIIEHDGLPRQRSANQEMNRDKTREELLAEERDYKRRRMSYRGKKLKRTPSQVVRDIIEDYMEEIILAGGIGYFSKEPQEEESSVQKASFDHDQAIKASNSRKNNYDLAPKTVDNCSYWMQDVRSSSNDRITNLSHVTPRDNQLAPGHCNHGQAESQRSYRPKKHFRGWTSRSPERCRSHVQSHEGSKHYRRRHHLTERYNDDESAETISRDRKKRSTYDNDASVSLVKNTFDDRYNPSESH